MVRRLYKKGLVFEIIVILIGASIIPIISGDVGKTNNLISEEENNDVYVNTLDNDLVGWWAFDEGEGGIAYDFSGNDNHGNIYGATWTSDTPCDTGSALDFDGYHDYVSFITTLIPTGSKTIIAWIKPHHDTYEGWENHCIIGNGNLGLPSNGFDLWYQEYNPPISLSKIGARIVKDESDILLISSPDYSINVEDWNFVAFTWDGTTSSGSVKLYIDDVLEATGSALDPNDPVGEFNAMIGGRADWLHSADRYWFNGLIDEIRIYNRELDENEIEFLYNNPGNQPPDNPSDPDPTDGETRVPINADLSWTCSDPDGDDIVYDVFFEADDPTPDVLVSNDQTETSYDPGPMNFNTMYYWQIITKDEYGASTAGPVWSFTTIANTSPNAPIIDGPSSGKPGASYPYTFKSTDPEEDDVYYYIDWGDDTYIDWFGPFASGVEIEKSHVFENSGTYIVYAQAKDIYDAESEWGTLTVTMPRDKAINRPILNFLQCHPNLFPILQRLIFLIK